MTLPIQHRYIAEILQNDFTETLHNSCETLLNHCCKIPIMLRCPLFVITQQNVPAILQCIWINFLRRLKWKLFLYIHLTNFNFFTNRISTDMNFPKAIFYDKTIKYSNKYSINSKFICKDKAHMYVLCAPNKLQILSTLT